MGSESHDPSLQSPALSASASAPLHRKRGRPKGSANPQAVTYGPKPRRGRPPGTGHKQKQILLGQGGAVTRRPRGRPKKQASLPAVSIEFGKVVSHNVISVLISLLTFC
jgi:hypothetical protein